MLRLPHADAARLISTIKCNVLATRHTVVVGSELSYAVFRAGTDTPDLAFYDEAGTIYLPDDLVALDGRFADLIAFHEHIEIRHKRVGRAHAYAHRRALMEELLAAKQVFIEPAEFQQYIRWRIGLYPKWKILDTEEVVAQVLHVLTMDRPRKGELFQVIKAHHL